jgi:hypothetical protein
MSCMMGLRKVMIPYAKHDNPRPESGTMTQRTGRKYVSLRALDNPASLMTWRRVCITNMLWDM